MVVIIAIYHRVVTDYSIYYSFTGKFATATKNYILSLIVVQQLQCVFLLPDESEIHDVYLSWKSDLVIFQLDLTVQKIVRHCRWVRTCGPLQRAIFIQRLSLTCRSKEPFNCCPWPSNNFSNKGNIPEAVEKVNYHAFFNTGHFSSRCLWGSNLFFDAEFEYPDWLTLGKKRGQVIKT